MLITIIVANSVLVFLLFFLLSLAAMSLLICMIRLTQIKVILDFRLGFMRHHPEIEPMPKHQEIKP